MQSAVKIKQQGYCKFISLNKGLTGAHVHAEGALGDPRPSEADGDGVGAGLGGLVCAAVGAVALVLHHHLHHVLPALRVSDHGRHVPCTGPCSETSAVSLIPQSLL